MWCWVWMCGVGFGCVSVWEVFGGGVGLVEKIEQNNIIIGMYYIIHHEGSRDFYPIEEFK